MRQDRTLWVIGWIVLCVTQRSYADDVLVFKPYGFLSPFFSVTSQAVDSFGNTNLSAPVTVSRTSVVDSARARDSFQITQSRFGTLIKKDKIEGKIEIDFINFQVASPTTNARPRLRVANIDYHVTPDLTVSLGQDWDRFAAPDKPFTWNRIGLYFQAGNVGFMRQQARVSYTWDDWQVQTAVGLLTQNATATDTEVEKSMIPTSVVQVSKKLSSEVSAGASLLGSAVRPASVSPFTGVYGVNTFFSYQSPSFQLHESIYYGQNLGSAGTLSLASASSAAMTLHELGGYVSVLTPLSKVFAIQGGLGAAMVMESTGSPLDYSPGVNMLSNAKVEFALNFQPEEGLTFYLQPALMQTLYYITANSVNETNLAMALQVGCFYQF